MNKFVIAFISLILALAPANAREWQSASGTVFDVYMVQVVENPDDEFAIMAMYVNAEDYTAPGIVHVSDMIFEEALIHFAESNDLTAAVLRFSPPGEYAEGELPPVTLDVRYETYGGEVWDRTNYLDVPVGTSRLFPSAPTTDVGLSSGEVLMMEPATIFYPDDSELRQLSVRVVYPFFVIDNANGERVMAMLWDEVVRSVAREQGVNRVSVAIFPSAHESRFEYRLSYVEAFSKENWESWPTYSAINETAGIE